MYMNFGNIYLVIACAAVTVTLLVIVGLFVYNHFAGMQNRTLDRMNQHLYDAKRKELKAIVAEAIQESGRDAAGVAAFATQSSPSLAVRPAMSQSAQMVQPQQMVQTTEQIGQEQQTMPQQPAAESAKEEIPSMTRSADQSPVENDPIEEILQAMSQPAPEKETEFGYMPYRRGRSGKLYTKEELQGQIKD